MAKRILVVENEKNLLLLYRTELEAEGYEVVTVTDGRQALGTVTQEPVDLIVLDLKLPDGVALDSLHEFMNCNRELKIVINTAYPMHKRDFRSWAADAFLTKSSDLTELKHTIHELLQAEDSERESG